MTVFELIRELAMCEPDSEVRIVTAGVSFGQTPSVGITRLGVMNGFDWDNGKVLIKTEVDLQIIEG